MSDIKFLVGADPEFFLKDKKTGKHVSAFGMIPGTKREPFKVEGGAVQVDGMALEFNINPAATHQEFDKNITVVLEQLREMVPEDYDFDFVPVAQFGKEYIDAQPDMAKELGCDPDYNAYTGEINPKPNADLGFRTASGHVHIGWTEDQDITDPNHIEACRMLTKQLDHFIGVPSLLWDLDDIRSQMYGKPGAFRPKAYGVEYRTLSNAWVENSVLRKYVFNQTQNAAQRLMNGDRMYERLPRVDRVFNSYSYSSVFDNVGSYYPHTDLNDYYALDKIHRKLAGHNRPRNVEFSNLRRHPDYFVNGLFEIRHYNDVTCEEYQSGEWTGNDTRQMRRKNADKPFIAASELDKETPKNKKKVSDLLDSYAALSTMAINSTTHVHPGWAPAYPAAGGVAGNAADFIIDDQDGV